MKKPVPFLLALAICLVQTTMAQSTFEKIFRINNQSTEVTSVFPVADGYVLLSQRGGGIINFTKLDSDGNYVTGQDVFDTKSGFIMSASMTSSGSFLVTGVSYEGNDPETSRQTGFFLMVASNLTLAKAYLLKPMAGNGDTWASGALQASDGSLVILAKSTLTSASGIDHLFEVINLTGNASQVNWQASILAGNENTVFDIAETPAGFEIYGAVKNQDTGWNLYLGTINREGTRMVRQLIVGGAGWDGAYDFQDGARRRVVNNASSIVRVDAGNLAVAAYTRSYGGNSTNPSELEGNSILVVHFPVTGDGYNWTAILDGSANERIFGPFGSGNFISLANGDLLLTGYTNSTGTETPYPGGFVYRFAAGSDGTVTPRWQHVFTPPNNFAPLGLAEKSDGTLLVAGRSGAATREGVLIQTTANGINPICCVSANPGKLALRSITPTVRTTTNMAILGPTLTMPYAEAFSATTSITTICTGKSTDGPKIPTIGEEPKSQTIASGQTANLSVLVKGTPPLNYQWYQGFSGTETVPVGKDSSTFVTPTLAATTQYWVRVSNSQGLVKSATATITVENTKWVKDAWPDPKQRAFNLTLGTEGTVLVTTQDVITKFGPDDWPCSSPPGWIYALDRVTGSVKWSLDVGHSAPPAVAANGTIYTNRENRLYGVDPATGAMTLIYTAGRNFTSSPAIGVDGTVFIGAGQKVLAINPGTRQLVWEAPTDKFVIQHPTIGSDGTVYVIPWKLSRRMYAFYPQKTTDQVKWTRDIGGFFSTAPVIGKDGILYAGAGSKLYAFHPVSGADKWVFTTPIAPAGYPVIQNITSEPVIGGNGSIYFSALTIGGPGGALYAVHYDGYPKWFFPSGPTLYTSPFLAKDGTIYYPADKLYVLNLLGKELWSKEDAGLISPVIDSNGTVYGGSYSHNGVFAIEGTSGGISIGHWPCFGHDPQRTSRYDGSFVGIPPAITVQPESKLIKSGETATFTVTATGDPVLSYHWYQGIMGDLSNPAGENAPSYTTPPLTQMTNFWVQVENAFGKDMSTTVMASPGKEGEVKWFYNTNPTFDRNQDGEIRGGIGLARDGTLYFGVSDARLYAMNPNGTLKWIAPVQAYTDQEEVTNQISPSTPVVTDDGTILISTLGYYQDGGSNSYNFGILWAINPDGSEKWRYEAGNIKAGRGSMAPWLRGSPAIGHDGTIYLASEDGVLHALNPDGSLKWKFISYENKGWLRGLDGNPPVVDLDGTIYFAAGGEFTLFDISTMEARLFALRPDGTLKWDYLLLEDKVFFSEHAPAIGPDGKIYVDNGDGYEARLFAINPDGSLAWQFPTGQNTGSSVVIGTDNSIYVAGSTSYRLKLYCLNPDGTEKWRFPKTGDPDKIAFSISTPVIGADGNIYFGIPGGETGYNDGRLYALKPDGTQLWKSILYLGTMGDSPPVIAPDGTLYTGTGTGSESSYFGFLFAINTQAFGVANTAWPMLGHDPQRLGRTTGSPPCEVPVILVEPRDSTIGTRKAIKLRVIAAGTGLKYQWYKGIDRSAPVGTGESFVTPDLAETTQFWVEVSNSCGSVNSRIVTISTTLTGIPEPTAGDFAITTYPNPATDRYVVEIQSPVFEPGTVALLDLNSRILYLESYPAGTRRMEIDLEAFSKGIYFCRIQSGNRSVLRKMVKI